MKTYSPTTLVISALAIASIAFVGGFAASGATKPAQAAEPIVNIDAWSEQAPRAPLQLAHNESTAAKCNPWDVSEVVMEEVLHEMRRRGWREPTQGQAVESMVMLGMDGIAAVDPEARMPSQGTGYIKVLSDDEAEQLRMQEIVVSEPETPSPDYVALTPPT